VAVVLLDSSVASTAQDVVAITTTVTPRAVQWRMVVYHHTRGVAVVDADHSVAVEEDVEADVLKMERTLQGLGTVVIMPPVLRMTRYVCLSKTANPFSKSLII